MPRELPNVGVSFAPEIEANSDWYLNLITKSNVNTPTGAADIRYNRTRSLIAPDSLGTNIGNRTYSFNTKRGRTYELGRIESGEIQLSVDNSDGLFDPSNSASAFYPNLVPFRPISVNCAYPLTGNILNDTNLKPPIPATAPPTYGDYRVSVGANDSNFELGQISNWYCSQPDTTSLTASSAFAQSGTYSLAFSFASSFPDGIRLDVPVVSGKQITVSLYFRGGINNSLVIRDGGAYGATLSTQAISSVGTFTQFTATVTPQTNKINISVEGTNNGGSNYIDTVQVEFGSSVSAYNTNGPTVYSLFNGFIERYPQTYQAPNRGQVNMVGTDAIASMSQNLLTNPYQSLILQDQSPAIYYYPLNESSDSVAAFNAGLYSQQPLTQWSFGFPRPVKFGDTSSATAILGSGNTCAQVNFNLYVPNNGGTSLINQNINDIIFEPNTAYTFSFWFNYTGTIPGLPFPDQYWIFQGYTGGNYSGASPAFKIQVDYTGLSIILLQNDRGTTVIPATTPAAIVPNAWNYASVTLIWDGTTYTAEITTSGPNGVLNTATGSGASTTPISFSTIFLQGMETNLSYKISNFAIHRGYIDEAIYSAVGRSSLSGESTGNRFKSVINEYSGMKYLPYQAEFGKSFMQPAFTEGISLADYSQSITDSEGGTWYVDGAGYAVFKDRWDRLEKVVPKVTFGDLAPITRTGTGAANQNIIVVASATNIAAGQLVTGAGIVAGSYVTNVSGAGVVISNNLFAALSGSNNVTFSESPYAGGDLLINYDPTYVLNDINVKRDGGAYISVQDQKSVASYYPRTYTRAITTLADSDASDAANFLLSRYKDPHARPEILTITPARNPALWSMALGLEVGDLVRVNKRPLGAPAISIDCFVEQIEHNFDAQSGDWITRVALSPTIVYYWNTAAIRFTSVLVLSPTSVLLNKGSRALGQPNSTRDIVAGQMFQHTIAGTTYVNVATGTVTEAPTLLEIPLTRVGTFTNSANNLLTAKLVNDIPMDFISLSATVTAASSSGGIGTFIANNNFIAGQYVTVTGLGIASGVLSLNGDYLILTATATQFTVSFPGTNVASGTGTAVNWLRIDTSLATGNFLCNEEIFAGTAISVTIPSLGGSIFGLQITARALLGTIQTVQGSGFSATQNKTYSHFSGSTVYKLDGSAGGNIPLGTLVTEFLPNQVTQLPYSVPLYQNYDLTSKIGSWTGNLQSGTVTTTTPASGIKYASFKMNALTDKDNFPSNNIATGQILSFYNGTSVENLAVIKTDVPSATDGSWNVTGYKIVDTGRTKSLAAVLTPDTTTVTCSGNVTASAIFMDGEFMQVTAGSGTSTLTVVRGTPDAAVWSVLTKFRHYQYDKIYSVVNAGFTNTYAEGNPVIEGYNVTTPIIGTARLGY